MLTLSMTNISEGILHEETQRVFISVDTWRKSLLFL